MGQEPSAALPGSLPVVPGQLAIDPDAVNSVADLRGLFEGRAESVSRSNRLQTIVPNLVDAIFTDFPGNSGETLRITIREKEKTVRRED